MWQRALLLSTITILPPLNHVKKPAPLIVYLKCFAPSKQMDAPSLKMMIAPLFLGVLPYCNIYYIRLLLGHDGHSSNELTGKLFYFILHIMLYELNIHHLCKLNLLVFQIVYDMRLFVSGAVNYAPDDKIICLFFFLADNAALWCALEESGRNLPKKSV